MNEQVPSKEQVDEIKRPCPECGKTLSLRRDLDGYGRPRQYGAFRFPQHAGNRWGRSCRGGGETYLGDV